MGFDTKGIKLAKKKLKGDYKKDKATLEALGVQGDREGGGTWTPSEKRRTWSWWNGSRSLFP